MKSPTFTIIIPTFNRPLVLRNCLSSLAHLDYPRECFEVIVVDDGSPALPVEVTQRFSESFDVKLLTQRHAGPAAARNHGAAGARGEFLAFTDDDCLPEPGWLNALAQQLSRTPDYLVGGRTLNALPKNIYSAASQSIIDVVYHHFNTNSDNLFFASNNIAVPTRMFHSLGGFNEDFQTSEDREFCDRWVQCGYGMVYSPDAICRHAHHLGMRSFCRQHFGYGRGAFRFHHERRVRYGLRVKPDSAFYRKLLTRPFLLESGRRRLLVPVLVCVSQIASAAGFACEMSRHFANYPSLPGKTIHNHSQL